MVLCILINSVRLTNSACNCLFTALQVSSSTTLFNAETLVKNQIFLSLGKPIQIPIFFLQSILLPLPLVKNKNTHNATQIFRQVLASILLIVVLLSSCSTKRGVKVLFDMPVKMEQVGAINQYISSVNHNASECVKCADLQILTADAYDHSLLKNLSSALFISVVFSLLFLPFFRPEEEHHYKLPKLGGSIPKYLLFSKLIFYDIR